MTGWRHRLGLVAFSGAAAGLLASGTAVLAKAPQDIGGKPACPCPMPTQACTSPMPKLPNGLPLNFDVRDVGLNPVDVQPGSRYAEYQACVVTDLKSPRNMSIRAMLLDQQGRLVVVTNGPSNFTPSPTQGQPEGAPKTIIVAYGRTQSPMTDEQWMNRSGNLIFAVDWTDKNGGRHQDTFYVPYEPKPNAPGN